MAKKIFGILGLTFVFSVIAIQSTLAYSTSTFATDVDTTTGIFADYFSIYLTNLLPAVLGYSLIVAVVGLMLWLIYKLFHKK